VIEPISVGRVLELHAEGIRRHGEGALDPPRRDCVEAAIGGALTAEGYVSAPGLVPGFVFAGYLGVSLMLRHCFSNGNKRAAWAAMVDTLLAIGIEIEADDADAKQLCEDIVEHRAQAEDVVRWLAQHAREIAE
jgi:prophage maintenance system killer protein